MYSSMEVGLKRERMHVSEAGVALATVCMVLLLLTVLIISAHFTMLSQNSTSSNYRYATQAQYVAEAGVQRALDWFIHRYNAPEDWSALNLPDSPRHYPAQLIVGGSAAGRITLGSDSSASFTFPVASTRDDFQSYLNEVNNINSTGLPGLEGRYQVMATLLATRPVVTFTGAIMRAERWRIESRGRIVNAAAGNEIASADNVAIIEAMIAPAFDHALCAETFDFNGMTDVDSYDSAAGAFGGTNQNGGASVGSFGTPCPEDDPRCYDRGRVVLVPDGQWDIPLVDQARFGCGGSISCGTNFCLDLPPLPNFTTVSNGLLTSRTVSETFTAASCSGCIMTPAPGQCPNPTDFPASAKISRVEDGDTITVPPNASGNYCIWIDEITGSATIDNRISGTDARTGGGALNIFINRISYNAKDVTVKSDRNNPVNIYITGDLEVGGGGTFNMLPAITTANGTLYAGTSNCQGVRIFASTTSEFEVGGNGNPSISAIIYAPYATTVLNGNLDLYGSIITNHFRKNGTAGGIHFDRNLSDTAFTVTKYLPNYLVRRIY